MWYALRKPVIFCVRLRGRVWRNILYCCERQRGCGRAATNYQRLDPDAEEGTWRHGVIQPELGGICWRVWISGRQQLLAGTGQGLPSDATGQCQAQSWGMQTKLSCQEHLGRGSKLFFTSFQHSCVRDSRFYIAILSKSATSGIVKRLWAQVRLL